MNITKFRRQAALKAISKFCVENGFEVARLRIVRKPDRAIGLIGAVPDGREFGIGYTVGR